MTPQETAKARCRDRAQAKQTKRLLREVITMAQSNILQAIRLACDIETLRAPYLAAAEEAKADLCIRIRDFAEKYGPLHYAELVVLSDRLVAEDRAAMRDEHEGIEPEREWARGSDCD